MLKIIEKWKIWFIISALLILPGVYGLFAWGLNFGIDFAGGTIIEMQFPKNNNVDINIVRSVFESKEVKNPQVSMTSGNSFLARTHIIDNAKLQELRDEFKIKIGENKELRYESVGPTISKDLTRKAIIALILASLMIVIYISWAFRSVPKPLSSWKFGMAAILALIHDLLFVIGAFAILGHFKGVEVDNLFITALLTILGFSVHDTIVVFDRIRENLKTTSGDLLFITNKSISETMSRSLNTSATVMFTLLALLLFGGSSIFWFVFALFIGIVTGTYSSIFIASVIVYLWHKKVKV
jgi:preprotein translocase subunit SecF